MGELGGMHATIRLLDGKTAMPPAAKQDDELIVRIGATFPLAFGANTAIVSLLVAVQLDEDDGHDSVAEIGRAHV